MRKNGVDKKNAGNFPDAYNQKDRATQFLAFKALPEYYEEILETERLTYPKKHLDEYEKEVINRKIHVLIQRISEHPSVRITYFVSDKRKAGGKYLSVSERIKRVDEYTKTLQTESGLSVNIKDIFSLSGEIFEEGDF